MKTNQYPKRKAIRVKQFDYRAPGWYFVTVCTATKACVLSQIETRYAEDYLAAVQAGIIQRTDETDALYAVPYTRLTKIGTAVEQAIMHLNQTINDVEIHPYVIMPNHIHFLIAYTSCDVPPLTNVVRRLKSYTSIQYGKSLWQRSFYDHIIRNSSDLEKHIEYIEKNPAKWYYDPYYAKP